MPTTTCRSSYSYHITLRAYNLSARATGTNESILTLRVCAYEHLHHGVFRLGRALDFNMSLHLEELQVYDSLPLGASAYDTCYVCYQYRVHSTPVHVVQARASLRLGRVTGEFMEFLAQMPGSGTCHVIRSECRMCAGYIRVRLPAAAVKRRRGRSWLGVASLNAATNSSCTANLSRRHRHVSP